MPCVDPRKVLGVLQIKIGVGMLIFVYLNRTLVLKSLLSYAACFGTLFFPVSGALSVATVSCKNSCLVKYALAMNLISAVAGAGAAYVFFADWQHLTEDVSLCNNPGDANCQTPVKHKGVEITVKGLPGLAALEVLISIGTIVEILKARSST